jgi:hypothetical protein
VDALKPSENRSIHSLVNAFSFNHLNISGMKIVLYYAMIEKYESNKYLRMFIIGDVKDGNVETKFVGPLDWRLFYSS